MKLGSEKTLQESLCRILNYKGLVVIRSRTDKPTSNNIGCPDMLFVAAGRVPCAWEIKLPGGKPTRAQLAMLERLAANGWNVAIICSIDAAITKLTQLENGISNNTTKED
jgi:hypothetical protein